MINTNEVCMFLVASERALLCRLYEKFDRMYVYIYMYIDVNPRAIQGWPEDWPQAMLAFWTISQPPSADL